MERDEGLINPIGACSHLEKEEREKQNIQVVKAKV
jgi:hypothetical protein